MTGSRRMSQSPVEVAWWEELEGAQSSATDGRDAAHWIAVYTDLIKTMRAMLTDGAPYAPNRRLLEVHLREAELRRGYWATHLKGA